MPLGTRSTFIRPERSEAAMKVSDAFYAARAAHPVALSVAKGLMLVRPTRLRGCEFHARRDCG